MSRFLGTSSLRSAHASGTLCAGACDECRSYARIKEQVLGCPNEGHYSVNPQESKVLVGLDARITEEKIEPTHTGLA